MQPRTFACHLIVLGTIFTASVASAQTAVSVSARVGDFHVAVANYYHVPEREVVVVRESRISDNDLPVVFFIAREARVPPSRVIALRQAGRSWWDISVRFGLRPDVYYVPIAIDPGPPYGRAYGHYKKPRNQWRTIVLTDADVVNMVHLRFLSEHYGVPAERVIQVRGQRSDVAAVYRDARLRSKDDSHGDGQSKQRVPPSKGNDDASASKGSDKASASKANANSGSKGNSGNGRGRGNH